MLGVRAHTGSHTHSHASARTLTHMPSPPWHLVEPPSTLYIVSTEDDLKAIASMQPKPSQFLKNIKQLVGLSLAPHGKRMECEGWMFLDEIKWIKKDGDQEYVPVVQSALDVFMKEVALKRNDMSFPESALRKLITGKYTSNNKPKDTVGKENWRWVDPPSSTSDSMADMINFMRIGKMLKADHMEAVQQPVIAIPNYAFFVSPDLAAAAAVPSAVLVGDAPAIEHVVVEHVVVQTAAAAVEVAGASTGTSTGVASGATSGAAACASPAATSMSRVCGPRAEEVQHITLSAVAATTKALMSVQQVQQQFTLSAAAATTEALLAVQQVQQQFTLSAATATTKALMSVQQVQQEAAKEDEQELQQLVVQQQLRLDLFERGQQQFIEQNCQQLNLIQQQAQALMQAQCSRAEQDAKLREAVTESKAAGRHDLLRELLGVKAGGAISMPVQGGRVNLVRLPEARKPSGEVDRRTNRDRAKMLTEQRVHISGAKTTDDVDALVQADIKQNKALYQKHSMSTKRDLPDEDALAILTEVSGMLGAAVMRQLAAALNLKIISKARARKEFSKRWHGCETGKIIMDDPKWPGKKIACAWLRVKSIHQTIQKYVNQQAAAGVLEWPSNVPSEEIWIEAIEDKGGGSVKLVLKFLCSRHPDSPYNIVPIGIIDRADDKYDMIKEAWGPLYEELSTIRRLGLCIRSGWVQRLPSGYLRRQSDKCPVLDERGQTAVLRIEEAKARIEGGLKKRRRRFEYSSAACSTPPQFLAPRPMPMTIFARDPVSALLHSPPSPVQMLLMPAPSSSAIAPALQMSPMTIFARDPVSALLHSPPSPVQMLLMPAPSSSAIALALQMSPTSAITPPSASNPLCAPCNVDGPSSDEPPSDEPPSEQRPDCWACSCPWSSKTSGRSAFSIAACPTAKREASATNGASDVRPILGHHQSAPPRLQGCTWSRDCPTCRDVGGELEALVRQWAECKSQGLANRKIRMFMGGDGLSQSEPMGHHGPTSKNPCLFCLAVLHETMAAGVPHLPHQPAGTEETREARHADPPARAGSAAFAFQAMEYAKAKAAADAAKRTAPEPARFDSCVRMPLIYTDGPPWQSFSLTPLHLFLGLSLDQVRLLEFELRKLDAARMAARGEGFDDKKLQMELDAAIAKVDLLTKQINAHEDQIASELNQMEAIAADEVNAVAVVRASKPRLNGRRKDSEPPLPFESEYRTLRLSVQASTEAKEKAEMAHSKAEADLLKVYAKKAGPYIRSFNATFDSLNLERQAYHGSALNGNDAQKAFSPPVVEKLTSLLASHSQVGADMKVVPGSEGESPYIRVSLFNKAHPADRARADQFRLLWMIIGEAASLFLRKEPLCNHEIIRYQEIITD